MAEVTAIDALTFIPNGAQGSQPSSDSMEINPRPDHSQSAYEYLNSVWCTTYQWADRHQSQAWANYAGLVDLGHNGRRYNIPQL